MRPGGRERDRRSLAGRARAHGRPGRALALAPEGARRSTASDLAPASLARARRLHAVGVGSLARPDPDRDRRRGRARRSRPGGSSRTTAPRCASSRCRAGSCSRRSRSDYRDEVLPPEVQRAALGRAGRGARLEQVGRRPRRLDLDRALRRLGARRRPCSSSSASTSTTSSRARRRCCSAYERRGRLRPPRRPPARGRARGARRRTT